MINMYIGNFFGIQICYDRLRDIYFCVFAKGMGAYIYEYEAYDLCELLTKHTSTLEEAKKVLQNVVETYEQRKVQNN